MKYDISKTKKLKFARYGGLSSVNQEGYNSNIGSFHSPPAKRGFYAFVWPYIELFLLGMDCTKDPRVSGAKFTYARDSKGVIITDLHPEYESYYIGKDKYWSIQSKEWSDFYETASHLDGDEFDSLWKSKKIPRYYLVQKPKPRIFEYNGVLWHHLGTHLKGHSILGTKGSWVKTEMVDYRTALEKEMHKAHKDMMEWCFSPGQYRVLPTNQMALRRGSMDHLEIFVEKL